MRLDGDVAGDVTDVLLSTTFLAVEWLVHASDSERCWPRSNCSCSIRTLVVLWVIKSPDHS